MADQQFEQQPEQGHGPEHEPEPEPEPEPEQGPLSKLTDKAVKSKFVQKVNENVPSSAKPYIEKGAEPAKKTIQVVDKTLQTEEAKRVALTAIDFFNAVTAFTLLILSWTATTLESSLDIKGIGGPQKEEEEKEEAKEEENNSKSEINRHINKGVILFDRYKVIAHTLISKMKKNKNSNNDNNNNEGNCSIDRVAKKSFQLAKHVSAYSLNQASQLSGPGSSTIAPVADYIISKLPDDAKQTVQQTTSPFQ